MFDIEKLFNGVRKAVAEFAAKHADETFYAFAIDADMLCLNSEEDFAETLAQYKSRWPDQYSDPNEVEDLKYNTGDWLYQGFYDLNDADGFDRSAYNEHYAEAGSSEDGTAPHTHYAKAMDELIVRLTNSDVFAALNRTADFRVDWVDHTY